MADAVVPSKPSLSVCANCRHMRMRAKIQLFEAQDLQSAGALKAQTEWNQEMQQRAQIELQRFQAHQPFEYEPHHYAWCAHFTEWDKVQKAKAGDAQAVAELQAEGRLTLNPITGEIGAVYELCIWHNEDGNCSKFEPK